MNRIKLISVLIFIGIFTSSCLKEVNVEPKNPNPDWSESTHETTIPNYTVVFDQDEVKRIDITISADNWQIMKDDLDDIYGSSGGPGPGQFSDKNPVFVPATITFNDLSWNYVGIRFKGNSSLRDAYQHGIDKFSFKLDFDQFEDSYPEILDQRFYGFKQLSLKNNSHDNSLLREKIASDIFRDAGIPSPQTAFYRVYVDFGEGQTYFGLYTLVEQVDNTVIKTQFIDASGNVYKPENNAASFREGTYSQSDMNKKTNEDFADYSDVEELYDALNADTRLTDTEAYKTRLENIFDVDAFMHWLAVNTVIQNWDTYGNMTHNFYLYNDPSTSKLVWIPWDNNEALYEGKMKVALALDFNNTGSAWPLIRYLINMKEYKNIYDSYVEETINGVFESTRMKAIYTKYYNLIEPYVIGSEGEQQGYTFLNSPTLFTAAYTDLLNHVDERKSAVEDYLN
jgi:spore coat protein H